MTLCYHCSLFFGVCINSTSVRDKSRRSDTTNEKMAGSQLLDWSVEFGMSHKDCRCVWTDLWPLSVQSEQTASTPSASARNHWAPLGLSQVHWCWLLITIGVWTVYLPKISYPSVNFFFFVRIPWSNLLSCDWEVNVYDYHYLPMHVGSDPFHCGFSWFTTLRLPRSETFCAENIIMI